MHLDQIEHGIDLPVDLLLGVLGDLEAELDVFPYGEVGEKGVVLEHRVNATLIGGEVGDVLPV